jgi:hypothetical protein
MNFGMFLILLFIIITCWLAEQDLCPDDAKAIKTFITKVLFHKSHIKSNAAARHNAGG